MEKTTKIQSAEPRLKPNAHSYDYFYNPTGIHCNTLHWLDSAFARVQVGGVYTYYKPLASSIVGWRVASRWRRGTRARRGSKGLQTGSPPRGTAGVSCWSPGPVASFPGCCWVTVCACVVCVHTARHLSKRLLYAGVVNTAYLHRSACVAGHAVNLLQIICTKCSICTT